MSLGVTEIVINVDYNNQRQWINELPFNSDKITKMQILKIFKETVTPKSKYSNRSQDLISKKK